MASEVAAPLQAPPQMIGTVARPPRAPGDNLAIPKGKPNHIAETKRLSPKKKEQLAHRYVNIVEYEFVPRTLRIQTGFKVSWLKHSGDAEDRHLIRFIGEEEKESDCSEFGFGSSHTRLFTRPGVYEYYCELHVFMRGEIIVEGSQGGKDVLEANPAKSSPRSPKKALEGKYQEYVSKRQSMREKLAQARSNRQVEIPSPGTESEGHSPNPMGDFAAMVEFGSFDEDVEVKQSPPSPFELPETESDFSVNGSSPEVLLETKAELAQDHLEATSEPAMAPSEEALDQWPSEETKTRIFCQEPRDPERAGDGFNAREAIEFLRTQWLADLQDDRVQWV
jgi:plastocyanin